MIVLSNTTAQTIQPGQSITFNQVLRKTGCGEFFRMNTGAVGLRTNAQYEVSFNANIGGATAATPVQLAIAIGGAPLAETTMISVPAAVTDFNNVAASTIVGTAIGISNAITVTNNGTTPVNISPLGLALTIIRKS